MQFFTAILSALVFAVSTNAAPADLSNLDVYSPPITYPKGNETWTVGSRHTITWETLNIPPGAQHNTGEILLGYYNDDNSGETLYTDGDGDGLAKGFPITAGSQDITVPEVPTRNKYFIVLMGDSGNNSPTFSII